MISASKKNLAVLPIDDGGMGYGFTIDFKGKIIHNGTDWRYIDDAYGNVYAIQDAIVVDKFYQSSDVGHAVVFRADYDDGTCRYFGMIHLQKEAFVNIGNKVKAGQIIGKRGGSPYINGKEKYYPHVHLYTTKCTTNKKYTWSLMKSLVIDPFTELIFHKYPGINYNLAKEDGYDFGKNAPLWEEEIIDYPVPVERDENKHQVKINSDTRYLRVSPNFKYDPYDDYCKRGIYNVYDVVEAASHRWVLIKDDFWVAVMSSDNEYLPVDYKKLYEDSLKLISSLENENKEIKSENVELDQNLSAANKKIVDAADILNS